MTTFLMLAAMALGGDVLSPPDALKPPGDTLKPPAALQAPSPPVTKSARDYAAFQVAVEKGETPVLAVGVDPEGDDYRVPTLKNHDGATVSPGRWKCRKTKAGYEWEEVKVGAKPAGPRNPADPNEDHRCPNCGTYQYVQGGQHADGSHTHTCPSCGTSWRHGGSLGYPGTRAGGASKPTPTKQQTTPAVQFGAGVQLGQFGGGLQFQLGRYPSGGG